MGIGFTRNTSHWGAVTWVLQREFDSHAVVGAVRCAAGMRSSGLFRAIRIGNPTAMRGWTPTIVRETRSELTRFCFCLSVCAGTLILEGTAHTQPPDLSEAPMAKLQTHRLPFKGCARATLSMLFTALFGSMMAPGSILGESPNRDQLQKELSYLRQIACEPSAPDYNTLHPLLISVADKLASLRETDMKGKTGGAWANLSPDDRVVLVKSYTKEIDEARSPCDAAAQGGDPVPNSGDAPVVVAAAPAPTTPQGTSAKDLPTPATRTAVRPAPAVADPTQNSSAPAPDPPPAVSYNNGAIGQEAPKPETQTAAPPATAPATPSTTVPNQAQGSAVTVPKTSPPDPHTSDANVVGTQKPTDQGKQPSGGSPGPGNQAPAVPPKPTSSPCLTVSPEWVRIRSRDTLTPIKISSCDSPAADLSNDKVKLLTADPDAAVKFPTQPDDQCKSAVTSVLDCNLTVGAKAKRQLYYVEVDDKDGKLVGTVALHVGDPSRYWLGMAGLDVTSSSGGPEQQWFARASIMSRLIEYNNKFAHGGLWAWVDAKIGSIPTAKTSALSSLTSVSAAVSASGIQNAGDITQSLEFHVGLAPSFGSRKATLLSVRAASPINSITGAQEYSLSQNLYNQFVSNAQTTSSALSLEGIYPQLWATLQCSYSSPKPTTGCPSTNPTTVAFVFPNRSRFYRDYFGGFRLWFDPRGKGDNFPGLFDVTVGQDEVVTGGRLRGFVLTLQGDYPIDTNGTFRVFGSVHMRIARNSNTTPLDMLPTTTFVDPTTSAVVVQSTVPLDQDYFRLGIGIDIVQVWNQLVAAAAKKPGQ